MAAYDNPFKINNQPVPSGPTSTAAKAAPNTREPVITVVLSDMALLNWAVGTNSVMSPRRAGLSMAPTTPKNKANPHTTGSEMLLVRSSTPKAIA